MRRLLICGAVAGPLYVCVSLVQALTRDGFDLARNAWSELALGELGWIQTANLIVSGLLVLAGAVGLRHAIGRWWGPALIGVYGLSMVAAGIFPVDPPGPVSWHGMLHFVAATIGFACLAAACFVFAAGPEDRRFRPLFSRLTGALFLCGFGAIASGGGAPWSILGFSATLILAWIWLTTLSIHHYTNR